MGTRGFSVRLDTTGETACVYVSGELDLANAGHLTDCVAVALKAVGTSELVLDLGQMTFCDSVGMQAMVNAQRACAQRGIKMAIHRPGERFRELLEIVGLGDHFAFET